MSRPLRRPRRLLVVPAGRLAGPLPGALAMSVTWRLRSPLLGPAAGLLPGLAAVRGLAIA